MRERRHSWARKSIGLCVLNLLLTIHVVWFYLARVPSYLRLGAFEQGRERTPFQYRMLLAGPLRWAHNSPQLNRLADLLTTWHAWFPGGVRAESLVEAVVDLVSIAIGGFVARELYRRSSRSGVLTVFVYPLTMAMLLSTYALSTIHAMRFVYDLPSMALLSVGLYVIHQQLHPAWLSAVFLLGMVNRETTLLLLVFFVLAQCARNSRIDWRESYSRATLTTALPLAFAWTGWHLWVVHRFAANAAATGPRLALNLGVLAMPLAWPQLVTDFGFLLIVVAAFRRSLADLVLRAWLWAIPVWFAFMLYYGLLIETRIFGELIPYLVCASALIAEERIIRFLDHQRDHRLEHQNERFAIHLLSASLPDPQSSENAEQRINEFTSPARRSYRRSLLRPATVPFPEPPVGPGK